MIDIILGSILTSNLVATVISNKHLIFRLRNNLDLYPAKIEKNETDSKIDSKTKLNTDSSKLNIDLNKGLLEQIEAKPKSKAKYKLPKVTPEVKPKHKFIQTGIASWYGNEGEDGHLTATGEIFHKHRMTAAHLSLPMHSKIKVTNLVNHREVEVVINDTGGFGSKRYNKVINGESIPRVLDCSEECASRLGYKDRGWTLVKIELIKEGNIPNPMVRLHRSKVT